MGKGSNSTRDGQKNGEAKPPFFRSVQSRARTKNSTRSGSKTAIHKRWAEKRRSRASVFQERSVAGPHEEQHAQRIKDSNPQEIGQKNGEAKHPFFRSVQSRAHTKNSTRSGSKTAIHKRWAEKRRSRASVFQERSVAGPHEEQHAQRIKDSNPQEMGRKTEKQSIRFSGTSERSVVAPSVAEQPLPKGRGTRGEVAVCTREVHTITERAGQTGEAERSPLSPDFHFGKSESKKSGDNSDRKLCCPRSDLV
ncbi:hypothetical protein DFQ00_102561 [Paenibacillus barcinonensis]|uniref:Uncharacterized protein n=1 Tax=Paenibacillus barcinonensis TaxID=198119 RepID=A0A2V4W0W3_PAEBA|nr:hypothetical protein DFQ00_102561 [Paenibacillus barcinonensis]